MLKAVIFDMDGVLINSEPVHYRANKELFDTLGIELDYEYYKQFIGSTNTYMWNKMISDLSINKTPEWMNEQAGIICRRIVDEEGYDSVEGACELVKDLHSKGYDLAVASSSSPAAIERNIRNMGLYDCFERLVSGEQVKNSKPEPDVFLEAARQLGAAPENCLVVEDSENGSKAVKAAGMVCLGYINPDSGNQNLNQADYLTESLAAMDSDYLEMIYCHTRNLPWTVKKTDRLIIREMKVQDVDRLYEIYAEPSITEYMENLYDNPREEKEFTEKYIEHMYKFYEYGMWVMCLENGYVIGRVGICHREIDGELQLEVGYVVDKKYQNNGYATEAVGAAVEYAREHLHAHKLNAFIRHGNTSSIKVAENNGFEYNMSNVIDGINYEIYTLNIR